MGLLPRPILLKSPYLPILLGFGGLALLLIVETRSRLVYYHVHSFLDGQPGVEEERPATWYSVFCAPSPLQFGNVLRLSQVNAPVTAAEKATEAVTGARCCPTSPAQRRLISG
jgi:hypothetical protein